MAGAFWETTFTANQTDLFWAVMETYWRAFFEWAEAGVYGYSTIMGIPGATKGTTSRAVVCIPAVGQGEAGEVYS